MKNNIFNIEINKESGGISSLVMCGDKFNMNWIGHTHHWGEVWCDVGYEKTLDHTFEMREITDNKTVYENPQLRITVTRDFDADGNFTERYVYKNISDSHLFFRKADVGIYVPLCDEYHSAQISLTQKCNAHIWCGEEFSWVNALRQGESCLNLGLVVTRGSLDAYSIDRENQTICTARRGNIIVHPELTDLLPDEEYVLCWTVFIHKGTDDFFEKLSSYGKNLDFNVENYTVMGEESFVFDFCSSSAKVVCMGEEIPHTEKNGRIYVNYKSKCLGEHKFIITTPEGRTHISMFASEDFETLLEKRISYIVNKQQYHNPKSQLDGAYLVYDTSENRHYFSNRNHDHNASRERLGMGITIARYLRTHKNDEFYASLMKYVKFVMREFVNTETGEVFNTIGKNPNMIRLYNAPWMIVFMSELYELTDDIQYLVNAIRIIRNYYSGGGFKFYPNAIDISNVYNSFKKAGMAELEEVKDFFVTHAENMVKTGLDYPPHEVIYEQTIVTPAVTLISQAGIILDDKSYIDKVQPHLEPLKRFDGMQPDYRFNGIPIRYWDDYWFGKSGLYADTLHYWSCLTAQSYYSYYMLSGEEEYKKAAYNCIRNCMCLFKPDGSASCAYVLPYFVDGIPGNFYDQWANDQDFALYFATQIFMGE